MAEIQSLALSVLLIVISFTVSLISAYIVMYSKRIVKKIDAETSKINNSESQYLVSDAILRLNELVYQTVFAAQTTIVKELRDESGKLEKGDGIIIAENVRNDVLAQLSAETRELIEREIKDIEKYIANRIEVELDKVKKDLL